MSVVTFLKASLGNFSSVDWCLPFGSVDARVLFAYVQFTSSSRHRVFSHLLIRYTVLEGPRKVRGVGRRESYLDEEDEVLAEGPPC